MPTKLNQPGKSHSTRTRDGGKTTLGAQLSAAAPFYGAAPETAAVAAIKAPLLIHYAQNDDRINAVWPGVEAALKDNALPYDARIYPGSQHGFHNNSTPR